MSFDPATLKYDANGLIPAIAQDAATGDVLMMAWMNAESLARTLETFGRSGARAVYGGPIGRAFVAENRAHGGILAVEPAAKGDLQYVASVMQAAGTRAENMRAPRH